MQTDKIEIDNTGKGIDEALEAAERFASTLKVDPREQFHLRLLAEEMLGMVRSVAGEFKAKFWIVEDNRVCRLNLEARTDLDYPKRKELLSVSTQGKNRAAMGIMAKIRDLIEAGLYSMEESLQLQTEYGAGILDYGTLGLVDEGMSRAMYAWSMQKYKDSVAAASSKKGSPDNVADEAWDELEKSIVANIADDVEVGVSRDKVELVITKKIPWQTQG